jgi:uncharacterized membrane protein
MEWVSGNQLTCCQFEGVHREEAQMHIRGHPVHQMLMVYPAGLLMTSVAFDVISAVSGNTVFATVAYWLIVAGIIMGVIAAVFGVIDWTEIAPRTRAKAVGAMHGAGNAVVMILFAISLFLRPSAAEPVSALPLTISLLGAVLLGLTAWLGGELVVRLGIGVNENAHPDAPSSIDLPGTRVPPRDLGGGTAKR